jgi:hypothetical protein
MSFVETIGVKVDGWLFLAREKIKFFSFKKSKVNAKQDYQAKEIAKKEYPVCNDNFPNKFSRTS